MPLGGFDYEEIETTLTELMGTLPTPRISRVGREHLELCTPRDGKIELFDFMIGAITMVDEYLFDNVELIELPGSAEVLADYLISGRIKVDGEWYLLDTNPFNNYEEIRIGYNMYLEDEYCRCCNYSGVRAEIGMVCGQCSCEDCWKKCFKLWQNKYVDTLSHVFWNIPFSLPELNG